MIHDLIRAHNAIAYRALDLNEQERALYGGLMGTFSKWHERVTDGVVNGTPVDFNSMNREIFGTLAAGTSSPHYDHFHTLATDFSSNAQTSMRNMTTPMPLSHYEEMEQSAGRITDTTQERTQQLREQYVAGDIDATQAKQRVEESVLGEPRASAIAVTEMTRTKANATRAFMAEAQAYGVDLAAFVWTRRDERVCAFCGPRYQQPCETTTMEDGSTWPGVYWPPYHTRCRCEARLRRPVPFPGTSPLGALPEDDETRERMQQEMDDLRAREQSPTATQNVMRVLKYPIIGGTALLIVSTLLTTISVLDSFLALQEAITSADMALVAGSLVTAGVASTVLDGERSDETQYQADVQAMKARHAREVDRFMTERASNVVALRSVSEQLVDPDNIVFREVQKQWQRDYDKMEERHQQDYDEFDSRYERREELRAEAEQVRQSIIKEQEMVQAKLDRAYDIRQDTVSQMRKQVRQIQLAKTDEDRIAAEQEYDRLSQKLTRLDKGIAETENAQIIAKHIPDHGQSYSYKADAVLRRSRGGNTLKNIDRAVRFVSRLSHPDHIGNVNNSFWRQLVMRWLPDGSRPFAMGNNVFMTSQDSSAVVAHEMGHIIEEHSERAMALIDEFLESRTANEETVKLADLFPGEGYSDDELTKVDLFLHPYIGKEYRDGFGNRYASEVLSMGLEWLLRDTSPGASFAKNDPWFFQLIYIILRGGNVV
jgi:hypothetical protein